MEDFKKLIDRSYKAIQKRGLINENTTIREFVDKIHEELTEAEASLEYYYNDLFKHSEQHKQDYIEEITDIATVCIMQLKHLGCDFIEEFEKVVIKNESRT